MIFQNKLSRYKFFTKTNKTNLDESFSPLSELQRMFSFVNGDLYIQANSCNKIETNWPQFSWDSRYDTGTAV